MKTRAMFLAALLLFGARAALGQISYGTITATVTDPNGNPYANAQITATFVDKRGFPLGSCVTPNGQPYAANVVTGTLDSTGHFSLNLMRNDVCIAPPGTQWKLVIGSPADPAIQTFANSWGITYITAVTGNADLSSQMSALAQGIAFFNTKTGQSTLSASAWNGGNVASVAHFNAGLTSTTGTFSGTATAASFVGPLTGHASSDLAAANNLSDVANAATARSNLGAQANLGYTPANKAGDTMGPGGLISNTVKALNVIWAGAKGDGSTDDTAVIQNQINLASCSGGNVYLPSQGSGKYYKVTHLFDNYDAALNPGFCQPTGPNYQEGQSFAIYGDGNSARQASGITVTIPTTRIVCTDTTRPCIGMNYGVTCWTATGGLNSACQYTGMKLKDLSIQAANTTAVVFWNSSSGSQVENVTVNQQGTGDGFDCYDCNNNVTLSNINAAGPTSIATGASGIKLYADAGFFGGSSSITLKDSAAQGFDHGIDIENSSRVALLTDTPQYNNQNLYLSGVTGLDAIALHLEGANQIGAHVTGNSSGLHFAGGDYSAGTNDTAVIQIEGAPGNVNTGITITGVNFDNLHFTSGTPSNWVAGVNIINAAYSSGVLEADSFAPTVFGVGNSGEAFQTNGTGPGGWRIGQYYPLSVAPAAASFPVWAASTAYALNAQVRVLISGTYYEYTCTTAGTSGSSSPTATSGTGVVDNTVRWTVNGAIPATITLAANNDGPPNIDSYTDPATHYTQLYGLNTTALNPGGASVIYGSGNTNPFVSTTPIALGTGGALTCGSRSDAIVCLNPQGANGGNFDTEFGPTETHGLHVAAQYGHFTHAIADTDLVINSGAAITSSNLVPQTQISPPIAGRASCIKSAGPPVIIGYCSTQPDASGACTCN